MDKHLICDFSKIPDLTYAREPVICKMKNGTLVCTFLTGGPTEPHNDNAVYYAKSYDDGETWTTPTALFSHSRRGVWATEIFNGGEYPLMVVHTYEADSHYIELQTYRSYTYDNGETWSAPVSFPSGISGVSVRRGIVLSDGSWLFPVYWQESPFDYDWGNKQEETPGCTRYPFRSGVIISRDGGKSFTRHGYLCHSMHYWEPNCVEAEPGHIILLMRTQLGILHRSDSFDYGKTWSDPVETDLPNANTKLTLIRIKDKILLISNFYTQNRTHLEIRISDNNGVSFDQIFPLEDPDAYFFYPHAVNDDEKELLYISYENTRQHYLVKIPYSELGL